MAEGRLPAEGPVRLGPVALPAGHLVTAGFGSGAPVAWVTDDPLPGPGRVWDALSQESSRTGLVPFLLSGLSGDTVRPWDEEEFEDPDDPAQADALDPGDVVADMWQNRLPSPHEDTEDLAPFGRQFPGLAAEEHTALIPARRLRALDSLPPSKGNRKPSAPVARIGLAAAARPADVLSAIGWMGCANYGDFRPLLTAVLRSWEDRFGARLIDVGFAEIRLLVERPPRTATAAEHVAAEHHALADESGGNSKRIDNMAVSIKNAPIWNLWWD